MKRRESSQFWLPVLSFLCIALLPLIVAFSTSDQSAQPSSVDDLVAATVSYVQARSDIQNIDVEIQRVDGVYARVVVKSRVGDAEPALVFLKRENNTWSGLTIGTAFSPEVVRQLGIPEDFANWLPSVQ